MKLYQKLSTAMLMLLSFFLLLTSCDDTTPKKEKPENKDVVEMKTGERQELKFAEYNDVTWTTSDPTIAMVGEDGYVTALNEGQAQITGKSASAGLETIIKIKVSWSNNFPALNSDHALELTPEIMQRYLWDYKTSPNKFISKADGPIILDCWATWCAPCKLMYKRVIEPLAKEYAGRAYFVKAEIYDPKGKTTSIGEIIGDGVGKENINAIPALFAIAPGKPAKKLDGYNTIADVKRMIREFFAENGVK
ncbi:thioredoxin domain-containing protein [Porphyromonas crevioricanis]|uniref:thioredoxin domain-containing protein n=1 Tax=Porphyromonas crevioricanis TaxID=393921 RepID=UPI00055F50CE|nr:thioredoxin domain-containing protein [Porphyromonas crevioricanis]